MLNTMSLGPLLIWPLVAMRRATKVLLLVTFLAFMFVRISFRQTVHLPVMREVGDELNGGPTSQASRRVISYSDDGVSGEGDLAHGDENSDPRAPAGKDVVPTSPAQLITH